MRRLLESENSRILLGVLAYLILVVFAISVLRKLDIWLDW